MFEAAGPEGAVALKQLGPLDDDRLALLRERWSQIIERPHPRLVRPIELFRGPGLFTGDVDPPDEDCDLVYAAATWAAGEPLRGVTPLALPSVSSLVQDIAAAVAHLHGIGLVHRDLHPGNVVIDDEGRATLIDLGAIRPDDGGHTSTIAGTLGFIAPERTHEVGDRRSDVWGVGMLVVFAILGHPKGRQSDAELRRELEVALTSTSDRARAVDLLMATIDPDPPRRPIDLERWSADLRAALRRPDEVRSSRRRWPVALGAGAFAVAALGAALVTGGYDDEEPIVSSGTSTSTSAAPPSCVPADFPTPEIAAAAGRGCPSEAATTFGEATVQPVSGPAGPGAVVASEAGVVLLTDAQLASYREIAGRERPENAITFGGYPVSVVDDGEIQVIDLSFSGLMIGDRTDTQAFWMPGPVEELWLGRGGRSSDLGLPMTNPYFDELGLVQDFAGGRVVLPADFPPFSQIDPSVLVVSIADDPGSGIAGLDLEGRFLRQPTGTVWFVEGGVRHWVPTGEVYNCLGGDDVVVADRVAGSDIASLRLEEPAACRGG